MGWSIVICRGRWMRGRRRVGSRRAGFLRGVLRQATAWVAGGWEKGGVGQDIAAGWDLRERRFQGRDAGEIERYRFCGGGGA
jgi:hypothetical protein